MLLLEKNDLLLRKYKIFCENINYLKMNNKYRWVSSYMKILEKMKEENRNRKYWVPIEKELNNYANLKPKNLRTYTKAYCIIYEYEMLKSRGDKISQNISASIYQNVTIFLENYLIKLRNRSKKVPQEDFLVFYLKERDLFDSFEKETLKLFIYQVNNSHDYDFRRLFRIQWKNIFYKNIKSRLNNLSMSIDVGELYDQIKKNISSIHAIHN